MSGGSFDYLCLKDASDLLAGGHEETMERMADALAARGFEDAAKETHDLILTLRQVRARIDARLERLSPVWKAIEWRVSCDWGDDDVAEAIEKYRGETSNADPRRFESYQ